MAEGSYIVWLVPACNCDIATYTRANDPPTATDPGLGAGRGFQPATRPRMKSRPVRRCNFAGGIGPKNFCLQNSLKKFVSATMGWLTSTTPEDTGSSQ